VLNPLDDYPIHQTSAPIAHPASASRNHFDRYFFNGYDSDGQVFFGAAMGLYPNRNVIDGAFSVLVDGRQHSINVSGRAPLDRGQTSIGPLRVEIDEPLRRLRIVVDAPDLGLTADVTFRARSIAYAEPPFLLHDGVSVVFDYTRMTQLGAWEGRIETDGTAFDLDPGRFRGARDRSWGVRPVGEQPEAGVPLTELPQFFWLWSPLDWGTHATHFSVNEDSSGRRWHQAGAVVPLLDQDAPSAFDTDGLVEPMADVRYHVEWEPGTRWSRGAQLELVPWSGPTRTIELEPLVNFPMCGLGYLDGEWGHGRWKDELAVTSRTWRVDALDPAALAHIHVQQLCRARDGDRTGLGVFEQLVLNDHDPTALVGFTDGYRAPEPVA
jgi:hypothetical protein